MSLSITVSGETMLEVQSGLLRAAAAIGGAALEQAQDAMEGLDVTPAKGKPGRPAKSKSAADMAADLGLEAPAPVKTAEVAAPAITEAQMKATMQGLMAERTGDTVEAGRDRVIKALGTIGCKTVREVKPEQYAALIKNASLI